MVEVLLVPGLGLDHRVWTGVRRLLPHARVVELPSLGRRAARGEDMTAPAQAERLQARLPPTSPVVLVGHSAACPAVVEAARACSQVVGVVLVGPVDPYDGSWSRLVRDWLASAVMVPPDHAPFLLPQYVRTGLRSITQGIRAVRRYPTDVTVHGLAVPVRVVRGNQDLICAAAWADHLDELGHVGLDTVDGGSHMVLVSHPEAVVAAVAAVLRSTATR